VNAFVSAPVVVATAAATLAAGGAFAAGLRKRRRAAAGITATARARARLIPTTLQPNPRPGTRGRSYARRAVEIMEGGVQHCTQSKALALELRRQGKSEDAKSRRAREYLYFAERAAMLAKLVGVPGGTGVSWLDNRRIDAWHAGRRYTLMHGTTGVTTDPPLRAWTAQRYRLTGGPRSGACHDLVRMFDSDLHHCQKALDAARYLKAHDLEDQARVLLRAERDRCIQLSFLPTETVEPM
jgi:hypothetical protein